ncbi:hypothetical protein P152DRAFT_1770 [Eremomyces bilateralis CBS 781.70]|uniref:Uncharacterized protein n=1 Tax=Eremomyces bilateralis CBS 781.70 TaxID=1392243 RepID=A0A6G1GFX6_9PEZI|nr:uncharacterized protein P152DRAFT_1770 [Eremomyces bilateralis CBS 781.70]KAF1816826.1 hypothetical protein P152DRAFT_1770 [Eremomyces bilateralis CBS 781.70]
MPHGSHHLMKSSAAFVCMTVGVWFIACLVFSKSLETILGPNVDISPYDCGDKPPYSYIVSPIFLESRFLSPNPRPELRNISRITVSKSSYGTVLLLRMIVIARECVTVSQIAMGSWNVQDC